MEGTEQLLDLANKALPGAWDAMIRQAYICGIGSMIVAVIAGITAIYLFIKIDVSEDDPPDEGLFVGMIGAAIICLIFLVVGVLYLINPGYHAIQMLKP